MRKLPTSAEESHVSLIKGLSKLECDGIIGQLAGASMGRNFCLSCAGIDRPSMIIARS